MRHAILALTLAAISSTAQAKITELMCTADNGRQWAVSTDDQRGRATVTYLGDGTVNADQRVAFTPDDVRIELGDNYYFVIDRTTLRFKAGSYSDFVDSNARDLPHQPEGEPEVLSHHDARYTPLVDRSGRWQLSTPIADIPVG